jgi:hypothetical protein
MRRGVHRRAKKDFLILAPDINPSNVQYLEFKPLDLKQNFMRFDSNQLL